MLLGAAGMMFYTFGPSQKPAVNNWVSSTLHTSIQTSNFFMKGLSVVIRKNIHRSYLAQASLQKRQTFISGRKREKEELKTAMGSVRG